MTPKIVIIPPKQYNKSAIKSINRKLRRWSLGWVLSVFKFSVTVGISGISAGLAGLITAQKIINFTLSLREETGLLTISDVKGLNIDNIVVNNNHNCYLK